MRLLLEVVSAQAASMGSDRRRIVGPDGAQIGREGSGPTYWVLPDPSRYVSRHHVSIRFVNGLFFVEGRGRTPIALNSRERMLRNEDPHPLNDGDRIFIDEYEIRATIGVDARVSPEPEPARAVADPIGALLGARSPEMPRGPDALAPYVSTSGPATVDPLELLGDPRPRTAPASRDVTPVVARSSVDELLGQALPPVRPAPGGRTGPTLEDDWFQVRPSSGEAGAPPPGRPAASMAPAVVGDTSSGLEGLLRGAGLDTRGQSMPAEIERQLGEALRIVVQGTMDVLRARNEIRNQFRMPVTQLARRDNNPLKFSVDAADALHNLLLKPGGAFLSTPEAFADAFEDIRFHQLAMLKGIEAGFERLMAQFDPDTLQQRFDKSAAAGGALGKIAPGTKGRRWEQYVEYQRELAADRDDAFRRLFGDAFAKAYEEELARLKAVSRASRRPGGAR